MLFTNMKLYDDKQIQRENLVISSILQKDNKEMMGNLNSKVHTPNNNHNGINSVESNKIMKKTSRMRT